MDYHTNNYTLGDIVGLVGKKIITHNECAEILEEEVEKMIQLIVGPPSNLEDYCLRLMKLGKQLEKMDKYRELC